MDPAFWEKQNGKLQVILVGYILYSVCGLCGFVVNFVLAYDPNYTENSFFSLWYAILSTFAALDFLWLFFGAPSFSLSRPFPSMRVQLAYHSLLLALDLISLICYGIAHRFQLFFFLLWFILVVVTTLVVLVGHSKGWWDQSKRVSEEALIESFQKPSKGNTCCYGFFKFIFLILVILLTSSSIINASGYVAYYPSSSSFHTIPTSLLFSWTPPLAPSTLSLYVTCAGSSPSRPTIWIEVGGGSCHMDGLYLQQLLVAKGWRVCLYDRLGYGWSDYPPSFKDTFSASQCAKTLKALMDSMGETSPVLLGGHSAGGLIILHFAHLYEDHVAGLFLMDAYPDGIEWTINKALKGWTQLMVDEEFSRRVTLVDVIRALGAPWGILGLFVGGGGGFNPPQLAAEHSYFYSVDKTWISQYWGMQTSSPMIPPLNRTITILAIPALANTTTACTQKGYPPNSPDCITLIQTIHFYGDTMRNTSLLGHHSVYRPCWDCTHAMVYSDNATFIVGTVNEVFGNLTNQGL